MSHDIESNSTNVDTFSSTQEKEIRISSVSEFIEKIGQLNKVEEKEDTETFYYRGHADRRWKLLPSIFRTSNGVEKEHLLFRDMVAHMPQSFSECKSALDYLVQMQHYELPTRLLDVTKNPLVALFFACAFAGNIDTGIKLGLKAGSDLHLGFLEESIRNTPRSRFSERQEEAIFSIATMASALAATSILDKDSISADSIASTIYGILGAAFVDSTPDVESRIKELARKAAEAGAAAMSQDGIIYQFSVPNDRVKHYDSDTISVLANLAKCDYREIYIKKYEREDKSLSVFNEQDSIRILLRQIKEEKPYFEPLIRPDDLSSIFLVKPKYGNPRITNQAGAFFLFGLGIEQGNPCVAKEQSLTKGGHVEIPSDWVRHKFIVPKEKKKQILKELALLGITESYIYPEIDKYAKELKKRYNL